MTPKDFMRSITPGEIQPSNLGLDMYRDIPSSKLLDVSILDLSAGWAGIIRYVLIVSWVGTINQSWK